MTLKSPARLGDPRQVDGAGARQLIGQLPAVAWLAHTIHGDETEGSDAALRGCHLPPSMKCIA